MITFTVELGARSYPIYIGEQLLSDGALLQPHVSGRVFVVCAQSIAELYLPSVRVALQGIDHETLILADSEQHKNLDAISEIVAALLHKRFDREATLIALGGGVVGDITGFAAACYQRGVPFIQIPTTLLAQVDSSVGGKTGVNHRLGKNMIGAFHQPRCVIADTLTLQSLPDRELRSGLAEVIKYGLICDAEFFLWLEQNLAALLARDNGALQHAVARSCANKARVVADDEQERGRRAILNLGHTFGHAIETETGYQSWTHGEAVAVGICLAAEFSRRMGWLADADAERAIGLIARAGLPTQPPPMAADAFLKHMARDKKARGDNINLVLLQALGTAVVTHDYPLAGLREMLERPPPARQP